jgi:hypothetical protein
VTPEKSEDQASGKGPTPPPAGAKQRTRRRADPKPGTKPEDTEGGVFERRVARLEFAEGAFVRLRVPVSADGAEQGRDVLTDIDILSIDVDSRLRSTRSSLECKSGRGQSGEPYTLVWLAGFRQLLSLDRVTLVRQTVSTRGRAVARKLNIAILDEASLSSREQAHAWLPEKFAHLDGAACLAAEARTETQLKGLPDLPSAVTKFLRGGGLMADSPALLSAVEAFGKAAERQGGIPEPAATVLSSHALVAVILAALQDAGRLDEIPSVTLLERLGRALTVGSADDLYLLPLLERADALVGHIQERTHRRYVEAGAEPLRSPYPSLRQIIAEPPVYLNDYVDFVERLRANPVVARELLQTAELVCFDAALGGDAWNAPAFAHLMSTEHHGLMAVALRCLGSIAGRHVSSHLDLIGSYRSTRTNESVIDRRVSPTSSTSTGRAPATRDATLQARREAYPQQTALLDIDGLDDIEPELP